MLRPLLVPAAAAAVLLLVTWIGPPMLRALVPILSLLPPGDALQLATGFATTGPLQTAGSLVGLCLGRLGRVEPHRAAAAVLLAFVAGSTWELLQVGLAPVLATGTSFLAGRLIGVVAALAGASIACRAGCRWAVGLALPSIGMARKPVEER